MAEKVTLMKLKVDLQCSKCYKKVKKVLSKFPEVRGQVFDDKQNIVTITVVSSNPEKIRDKICCKGGGAIKSIEIVEPPKKPEDKKKDQPKGEPEEKKDSDKPKTDTPKKDADKPADKPKDPKPKPEDSKPAPKNPNPVPVWPPPPPPVAVPIGVCCVSCYEGQPGGPCFHGYGGPTLVYDGYYGRPVYDSYGGGSVCSIM